VSQKTVSEIYFDRAKGLVLVLLPDGVEILLGNQDHARRVLRIRRVVEYLQSEDIKGKTIDARFSKKVVVRLRNES
jgi:hypothetical protein